MKVKEIIKLLKQCPQDYEVILSEDPEGNAFRWLSSVEVESSFGASYDEDGLSGPPTAGVPVVILWPSGWVDDGN